MKKIVTQFSGDLKIAAVVGIVLFLIPVLHAFVTGFTTATLFWAFAGGIGTFLTVLVVNTLPSKVGVGVVAALGLALYLVGSFDHFATFDDAKKAVPNASSTTVTGANTEPEVSETP